jgi:tRNA pseudouridine55 synthase
MALKVISTEELRRGLVDKATLAIPGIGEGGNNAMPAGEGGEQGKPTSIRARAKEPIGGILPIYKKYGETPLECLNRLREEFPILKDSVLSYAGRLDPLAEGLMIILVGKEANQGRHDYLKLDKVYEVEVLFGLSTDTGDVLGMPKAIDLRKDTLTSSNINQVLETLKGHHLFHYPLFSSRTVKGKPLFEWAKEDRLDEIVIPTSEINVMEMSLIDTRIIEATKLFENIKKSIGLVTGDFRQAEIVAEWDEVFFNKVSANGNFLVCKLRVKCSSGSYMRTLAEEIGRRLGLPALACNIKRTAVGDIAEVEGVSF